MKQQPAQYEPSVWSLCRAVDEATRLNLQLKRVRQRLDELAERWARRAAETKQPASSVFAECQNDLDELLVVIERDEAR